MKNIITWNSRMVYCFAIVYLLLPFLIFSLSFIKLWIGIPIVILIIASLLYHQFMKANENSTVFTFSKKDLLSGLIILGTWCIFSGIGGFAFQNWDHHFRNALFSDLINYDWPVYYLTSNHEIYALTYYIGYWLPSALIGKVLGHLAAELSLFIWTLGGIFFATIYLKQLTKSSLMKSSMLLILFSGMDVIGVFIAHKIAGITYPTLWPPISHLEWWPQIFEFSSFTTQLFWVFNQAVPCWVAMGLLLSHVSRRCTFLIWSLCFFMAPFPAIGIFPFLLLRIPNRSFNSENVMLPIYKNASSYCRDIIFDIRDQLTIENASGLVIFLLSLLYFSSNQSASSHSFNFLSFPQFIVYVLFILLEFGFLWLIFYKEKKRNLWWYVVGIVLLLSPLFTVGQSYDFCMRASIPALFILMVWSGEYLFRPQRSPLYPILLVFLIIGSVTPIFEINRSIYRTFDFWVNQQSEKSSIGTEMILNQTKITPESAPPPEIDHPHTLIADQYKSLTVFDFSEIGNFVGETKNSLFFQYIARKTSN